MSRVARLSWCALALCIVCLQLAPVAALDVDKICTARCSRGGGGILCNCEARHFSGKRSGRTGSSASRGALLLHNVSMLGSHHLRPKPQPSFLHSVNRFPADVLDRHHYYTRRERQWLSAPGGSQMTYGKPPRVGPLSVFLENEWDASRVGEFINSLKGLGEKGLSSGEQRSVRNTDQSMKPTIADQDILPFLLWSGADRQLSPGLDRQVGIGSFGKPSTKIVGDSFGGGRSNDERNDDDRSVRSDKAGLNSNEASLSDSLAAVPTSEDKHHLAGLQEFLHQALQGR